MSEHHISAEPMKWRARDAAFLDLDGADRPAPSIAVHEPTFWRVLWAWEKLRVVYNVLMLIVYCILMARFAVVGGAVPQLEFMAAGGVIFFVIVNVPYCFCHALEIYLHAFGISRKFARPVIFMTITCLIGGAFLALVFAK